MTQRRLSWHLIIGHAGMPEQASLWYRKGDQTRACVRGPVCALAEVSDAQVEHKAWSVKHSMCLELSDWSAGSTHSEGHTCLGAWTLSRPGMSCLWWCSRPHSLQVWASDRWPPIRQQCCHRCKVATDAMLPQMQGRGC